MPQSPSLLSLHELMTLIEEATEGGYDEDAKHAGFFAVLGESLSCPFEALVQGRLIEVVGFDWPGGHAGVQATCESADGSFQSPLVELEWSDKLPDGYEWVQAYKLWYLSGR